MEIKFFDSNMFIGRQVTGTPAGVADADGLLARMDDLGIEKALVWHVDQYECSPVLGNTITNSTTSYSKRLFGCWSILPPQTGEIAYKDFFSEMKTSGITALRAFPDRHLYILNRQVFGGFLDEVSERKIPLLLSISEIGGTKWSAAYDLLKDYPNLTSVICDTGVWQTDRSSRPLLENYPNVYMETSMLSLGARILEEMVATYGPGRFLFGTGFPLRYPEASMLHLTHAEFSDEDKSAIAAGNLEKLIAEVEL